MTQRRLLVGVSFGLALYLGCVAAAFAATVHLTWTNPTQYADNSPLAAADIVSHRAEWTGDCPNFGFVAPENNISVAGNSVQQDLVNVTPGNRCFRVFVTARTPGCVVTATELCTRESLASNVLARTASEVPKVPKPPTLLDALVAWLKSAWSRWFA